MAEFDQEYLDKLAENLKSTGTQKTAVQKRPTAVRDAGKRVLGGALKVIDIIERPYNALMNLGLDIVGGPEGLHPVRSLKRGIKGEDKTGFKDITKEIGWKPDTTTGKIVKGGVDFVGGVLLDPATYVSGGMTKGATLLGRGVKPLSKAGTLVLEKQLAKELGVKAGSKGFKKALQKVDNDIYRKAAKRTLEIAEKNPGKYFATTKLKFAGKDVADLSAVATGVKKALKPILDIPIVKRGPIRIGNRVAEVAGDMFIPRYSLMKSRNLTMAQKFDLTSKASAERIASDTARDKRVEQAIKTFQGYSKDERKKITYELEKFLRTPELDADGNLRKFKQNTRKLDEIKDKKIRQKVGEIKEQFKELWEKEVEAKLRDKKSIVEEGYVKRIAKGFRQPTRGTASSLIGRQEAVPTIEESIKKFKAGEQAWRFEDDVAKILVERSTESDALFARRDIMNWLEGQGYMRKLNKGETSLDVKKAGLELVDTKQGSFAVLPEIAREFNLVKKTFEPEGWKEYLKFYDRVLDFWKLSVTSIWPSFHSRNAMSNVFLDFIGGVRDPKRFKFATDVQMYGRQLRKGVKPKDKTIKVNGKTWQLSELHELAVNHDILGTGWVGGDFLKKAFIKPKGIKEKVKNPYETFNWATGRARDVGTAVENNARMALFIDQLVKGKSAQEAALHTKKFLFDYQDLTEVERKVFKRILPFYTWMRKNIPLQLEQMAKQPGKYTGFVHLQEGIEGMSPDIEERLLPEWMRTEEMFIKLPGGKMWRPDMPFQDLANIFSLKKFVSASSPLIKGFGEIVANKDFFTGKPLADENLPNSKFQRERIKNWLLKQMRTTSYWKRATDEDRTSFQFYLDLLFGQRTYKFDEALGRKQYLSDKKRERKALLRFERSKKKARAKVEKGIKTVVGAE